jgi:hypothetical protein
MKIWSEDGISMVTMSGVEYLLRIVAAALVGVAIMYLNS